MLELWIHHSNDFISQLSSNQVCEIVLATEGEYGSNGVSHCSTKYLLFFGAICILKRISMFNLYLCNSMNGINSGLPATR